MNQGKDRHETEPLAAYEPPRALRLQGLSEGRGGITPAQLCLQPGSGAVTPCSPGVSAFDCAIGYGAAQPCAPVGALPVDD
jgi:hypothetical protein